MTIQANTFLSVNFDHCYSEGFKALKMQQSVDNNPFQIGSKEAHYIGKKAGGMLFMKLHRALQNNQILLPLMMAGLINYPNINGLL